MLTLALLVLAVGGVNAQTALEFDAFGKATIAKGALVGAGGLTYNAETGALSSDGTEGTLTLEFTEPVDLKNLKHFNVTNSGQTGDILDCLKFFDEDGEQINQWNSIKLSNTWNPNGIDDNATNAFLNNKPVKKLVWPSAANDSKNGKTATITSVEFSLKTIACSKAGETQLNTLPWNKKDGSGTATPDWNMNGSSDTYYGNYSGDATHYADLTSYSELRVYCKDNNTGFRCFFINEAGTATNQIHTSASTWNDVEKYYSLNLSTIEKWEGKVALKAMKAENGGGPGERFVTNIVVYNAPAANAPQYILTGAGFLLPAAKAALADASVTSFDATGVTGITTNSEAGRTLLTSANPNCLFLGSVGNGKLANDKNVVDGSTCANLELVDGKPFNAPADFTATAAKFTKTVGEAGYATMVIPFSAALPAGVEAYNITGNDGNVLTTSTAEAIETNKPVMLKNAGDYNFTASNVEIAATTDGVQNNGLLYGAYTAKAVPTANTYVLQKQGDDVNFYKAIDGLTVNPFRAYLTASAGARLTFDFNETNGIKSVETTADNRIYNIQGVRVDNPTKGLYIVNGKKAIVK